MTAKLFLLALLIFFVLDASWASSERPVIRATVTRSEKVIDFTRAARRSQERLSMLAARLDAAAGGVGAQTPLQKDGSGGDYAMTFSIGTPPQTLSALADTGSDLIWLKCGACMGCAPQGSPSYYPNTSSSFSKLPCSSTLCTDLGSLAQCGAGGAECDYKYSYGLARSNDHYTKGYLSSETFTLGSDAVPDIGFGCTTMSEGGYGSGSGLVGLGGGPLSLVKQLNVGAFSYCLTSDASKTSPLLFGSGVLSGADVQSTPLISGDKPTFYAVDLQSISIGEVTTLGTGSSGIVFDSGTTLTFLAEPAYTLAMAAILAETNLPVAEGSDGFDVCFQTSGGSASLPSMVLHFDGADMDLPVENYFVPVGNGVICWIVQRSPSLSIVGNIMQMNYHVRYDVENSQLSFQPANCDDL